MSLVDTNKLIGQYLQTSSTVVDPLIVLVGARIYCPRLPEKATLPAISYFTRGGVADAEVPSIFSELLLPLEGIAVKIKELISAT